MPNVASVVCSFGDVAGVRMPKLLSILLCVALDGVRGDDDCTEPGAVDPFNDASDMYLTSLFDAVAGGFVLMATKPTVVVVFPLVGAIRPAAVSNADAATFTPLWLASNA